MYYLLVTFIVLLSFGFGMYNCNGGQKYGSEKAPNKSKHYRVLEIDSCEYIKIGSQIMHKGNCKFCLERNK